MVWQVPPPPDGILAAEHVPYTVVYEDDWLLVVDKPAGVVVHPAPGHEHGTLAQGLVAEGARGGHEMRPGIVHRLDKDTSGLLIVARRDDAYRRLVAAMERRDIHRTYIALLSGDLPQDKGTIDAPIGRHLRDRKRMSLHTAAGNRAVTHFDVAGRAPGFTLVRVRLETGRTHQIRVHFSALGHPVAGDVQYGRPPRPDGLTRQFLHAARLAFPHPEDGRRSPVPARSRPTSRVPRESRPAAAAGGLTPASGPLRWPAPPSGSACDVTDAPERLAAARPRLLQYVSTFNPRPERRKGGAALPYAIRCRRRYFYA